MLVWLAILLLPLSVQAMGLGVVAARGDDKVSKLGVLLLWEHPESLWQGRSWQLGLQHEIELAIWDVPYARNVLETGYTPVFRWRMPLPNRARQSFYLEAAIGLRFISHSHTSVRRYLSSNTHFSDLAGLGWQWCKRDCQQLGLRIQHLSNAGIKRPNPGINFIQVKYSRHF